MKGSASGYGVSGSGEYTKTDYEERRKDKAIGFGMILVVLAVVGVGIWYFWNQIINGLTKLNPANLTQYATDQYNTAKQGAINTATNPIPATEAQNKQGQYYPVTTPEGLKNWLDGAGVFQPLVVIGNTIAPQATTAGKAGADTVNKLGLNDEYVALGLPQKALVTLGEGIGMAFGVDLIQLGYDMKVK